MWRCSANSIPAAVRRFFRKIDLLPGDRLELLVDERVPVEKMQRIFTTYRRRGYTRGAAFIETGNKTNYHPRTVARALAGFDSPPNDPSDGCPQTP